MMSIQKNLYPVTKEASQWRALSLKTRRSLLAAQVALIAGIAFVLVGMALGFYFTTSHALFCLLPALVGTPLVVSMASSIVLLSCSEQIYSRLTEGVSKIEDQDEIIDLLTKKELKDIYLKYYKKNGGLKGLVLKGYILPEQGDELRRLLEEYHEKKKIIENYESEPLIFSSAIQNNRFPAEYSKARKRVDQLNAHWFAMKQVFGKHYQVFTPPLITTKSKAFKFAKPTLMSPTAEACKWRDIDTIEKNEEIALRVLVVTAIILLALAIAVSCYFCATTTLTYTLKTGKIVTESNAFLMCFPLIFGSFVLASLLTVLIFSNLERNRHGINWDALDQPHIRDSRILLLTEGTLEQVHARCYQKNGGLRKFVQKGFLTVDQGNTLRRLLKQHDENKKSLAPYTINLTTIPSTLITNIIENPAKFPAYNSLLKRKAKLNAQWQTLQAEIQRNFNSSPPTNTPTIQPSQMPTAQPYISKNRAQKACSSLTNLDALPFEIQRLMFEYVPVRDLGSAIQLNHHYKIQVEAVLELRARMYGTELIDLPFLLKSVEQLASKDYIPKECIVYRSKRFSRTIDCEATLNRMRCLPIEEGEELCENLGYALLHYTKKGDLQMIKALLTLGANLEMRAFDGSTPLLICAAEQGKEDIAELLIKQGADIDAIDHQGWSPLLTAAYYSDVEMTQLILENRGDFTINYALPSSGNTALHEVARMTYYFRKRASCKEKIELLLLYEADRTVQNRQNNTPAQLVNRDCVDVRDLLENI